jgi:hypothetical protein
MDTESTHMGIGRGDVLVLLLKRKRGEQPLERSPSAPVYQFTEDEFTTFKLYTWYVKPESGSRWTRTAATSASRRSRRGSTCCSPTGLVSPAA